MRAYEPLSPGAYADPSIAAYLEAFRKPEAGDQSATPAFAALVGLRSDDQLAGFHLKRLLNGAVGIPFPAHTQEDLKSTEFPFQIIPQIKDLGSRTKFTESGSFGENGPDRDETCLKAAQSSQELQVEKPAVTGRFPVRRRLERDCWHGR